MKGNTRVYQVDKAMLERRNILSKVLDLRKITSRKKIVYSLACLQFTSMLRRGSK